MTDTCNRRGGAPVGYLTELDGVEAASVIYLRLWAEGPKGQVDIWQDVAAILGLERADHAVETFSQLCLFCGKHGRRPLMRHALGCKCLGADEACFANFIGAAADGERDDAMLMATLLVRPDVAPVITALATDFGMILKQMRLGAPRDLAKQQRDPATVLH